MRRGVIIAVALFAFTGTTHADQGWQDTQNTAGFVAQLPLWQCPLQSYSDGTVSCFQPPYATWQTPVSGAAPNTRWFCLDGTSGSDANVGYSDTSAADCGTKAVRTSAQMNEIIPANGNGRNAYVLVRSDTYGDWLSFASGRYGYNGFVVRATVTDATSGAVAFSDSAIDRIQAGGVTATGMNASGYNPAGTPTTRAIQCTKVGGGSPAFPAEVPISLPGGARLRFSATTATTALQNFVTTVVKVTGGNTLEVAELLPAVPTSSDVFYLEMPGAIFTHVNALGQVSDVVGSFTLVGIQTSGTISGARGFYLGGGSQAAFCWNTGLGIMEFSRDLFSSFNSSFELNGVAIDTGGACRASGVLAVTGGGNFGVSIGVSPYAGIIDLVRNADAELPNSFVSIAGIAIDMLSNQAVNEVDGDFIGTNAPTFPNGRASRILGPNLAYGAGLFLGSSAGVSGIEFSGMGANPCIKIAVQNGQYYFRGPLSNGSAGGNTDVGLDLTASAGSVIVLPAVPTVTGTVGDVRLCDGTIVTWTQAAAGIVDACGNRLSSPGSEPITVLPAGTTIKSLAGGGTQCVQTNNAGLVSGTGTACGSGSGAVISVTGTAQRVSVSPTTGATVVDTIGGFYSGAVTSGNEDLGTTLTNGLVCDTTTAGVAVLRTCASGADYQPPTAKTCTGGQFLNEIDVTGAAVCASPPGGTVTSVGAIAPITTTGGTTPSIGISLPASQVATGTGTNVTSSANLTANRSSNILIAGTGTPAVTIPASVDVSSATGTAFVNAHTADSAATYAGFIMYLGADFTGPPYFQYLVPTLANTTFGASGSIILDGNSFSTGQFRIGNSSASNGIDFYTTVGRVTKMHLASAGDWDYVAMSAPGTPASGTAATWVDSTSKNLAVKNDAGTVNHGAQTKTNATGVALTALADDGSWTTQNFQAPLTACTDYVSVSCQGGSSDIGTTGSNSAVPVIGIEDAGKARGYIDWTARTVPANPAGTVTREYNSLFGAGLVTLDSSGNARFMAPNVTCSGANVATSIASGTLACGPASVACGGLPALTGPDVVSSAGSCGNKVKGVTDGANVDWPVSGTFANNQAMITSGGNWTTTNECNVFSSCSAGGALTGSYPNPGVNLAAGGSVTGTLACGNLSPFGGDLSSAGGTCSVQVQAIEETSGPQRLAINAIPDLGAGHFAVLNRPGGTGTVVGTDIATLVPLTLNVTLPYAFKFLALLNTGELIAGGSSPNPTGSISVVKTEYPTGVAAGHVTLRCNLVTNFITTGTFTVKAARNGADTAAALSFTSSTAAVGYVSGPVSVSSPSAADAWGLDVSAVGLSNSCGSGLCSSDAMCMVILTP